MRKEAHEILSEESMDKDIGQLKGYLMYRDVLISESKFQLLYNNDAAFTTTVNDFVKNIFENGQRANIHSVQSFRSVRNAIAHDNEGVINSCEMCRCIHNKILPMYEDRSVRGVSSISTDPLS